MEHPFEGMEHPTVSEIRAWLQDPVTVNFLGRIKLKKDDSQKLIFLNLAKYELNEAALHNAGRAMCVEILEEPERMVEDAKDAEEEKGE